MLNGPGLVMLGCLVVVWICVPIDMLWLPAILTASFIAMLILE